MFGLVEPTQSLELLLDPLDELRIEMLLHLERFLRFHLLASFGHRIVDVLAALDLVVFVLLLARLGSSDHLLILSLRDVLF